MPAASFVTYLSKMYISREYEGKVKNRLHSKDEIPNRRGRLFRPIGERVRPSFTHSTSFGRLETPTSSTASETVGGSVSVFVSDDVVLDGAVTFRLDE
jgi:hypothetical protein